MLFSVLYGNSFLGFRTCKQYAYLCTSKTCLRHLIRLTERKCRRSSVTCFIYIYIYVRFFNRSTSSGNQTPYEGNNGSEREAGHHRHHTYIYIYIYTHIYTYTHTHIYIYICIWSTQFIPRSLGKLVDCNCSFVAS